MNPMIPVELQAPPVRNGQAGTSEPSLAEALAAHEEWIASHGRNGEPAQLAGRDLTNADLRQLDLRGANLRSANLTGANLRATNLSEAQLQEAVLERADLREADLSGADLTGANLSRADLNNTQFRRATLRDASFAEADLANAAGLLPAQLGGTVLNNARLPLSVQTFEGLATVTEASKTTQSLFTTIVLVCAYTWLTVASTTDAQLLNNAAPPSSRMPILGIDIPLVRFYMVAPLLLVSLYIYFHLSLQRLWEELADLPAVFPDGKPLDRKAYPWLMNGLVRAHAPRLRKNRTHLSRWQTRISSLLAWGLVPMTLLVLWGRYLRSHDWVVTRMHVALIAITLGMGVGFLRLAGSTLRGSEWFPFLSQRAWKTARAFSGVVAVGTGLVLWLLSFGAIEGVNRNVVWSEDVAVALVKRYYLLDPRRWEPLVLQAVGYSPSAVLDDAPLSTKPANWSPLKPDLDSVRGADLEERNLRFASAYNAFFVNAYLHYADLRWGDFRESDFRRADLRDTLMAGANLRDAHMAEADFRKAQLAESRFYATELERAKFKGAYARNANFENAKLRGADLTDVDLSGATLVKAQLQEYTDDPTQTPKKTLLIGATLEGADLTGANLTGADVTDANLRRVNFTDTILKDADLSGADLTGATGLTRDQLSAARIDADTRLPDAFRPQLALGP